MVLLIIALLLLSIAYVWNAFYQPSSFYLSIIIVLCLLLIISEVWRKRRVNSYIRWGLIGIVLLAMIMVPWHIAKNDNAALTYWGAVIGGIASGCIAVIGVFATISYYKQSDADKARLAIRPFLEVTTVSAYQLDTIKEKAA